MFENWLQKELTVAEAEAAHMVLDDDLGPDPVPFGFQNHRWQSLLAQMQKGDEIWAFRSPDEDFEHNAGRAGTALVRDGKIVVALCSIIS
jgi:hypothetical protein